MSNHAEPAGDDHTMLALKDVAAGYGPRVRVFENLSLELNAGTIVALQGRSGCGKSTALAIACGLMPPTAGTVLWHGQDLYTLDDEARAEIRRNHFALVLQNGGLLTSLTALENVLVPVLRRRANHDDRDRAIAALETVGVAHRAAHRPAELSGGEIQRVALARALFANADILVLDEPTASLDRRSATALITLIEQLRDTSRAILLASHDHAVIDTADQVHDMEPLEVA